MVLLGGGVEVGRSAGIFGGSKGPGGTALVRFVGVPEPGIGDCMVEAGRAAECATGIPTEPGLPVSVYGA